MNDSTRITREEMLLAFAHVAARRGTCDRLHVGAVIARESRPISAGYVGAPSGEPHCGPSVCDVSKPCTRTNHAERNAIDFARHWGIDIVGCDMFVTDAPCLLCAQAIIESGITRVFYDRPYRLTTGLDHLRANGVHVIQIGSLHAA